MKTRLATLFVLFTLIVSACSFSYDKGTGLQISSRDPQVVGTTAAIESTTTPAEVAATEAPSALGEAAAVTYVVNGKTVNVYSGEALIAKVVFTSNFVDNNPSEWLKGRPGIGFLYQSGVGNTVTFEVTLYAGGAFALDGDWAQFNGQNLGIVNNSADFMAFGDGLGTFKITGSTIGLAIGVVKDENDKAGYVYADRIAATGNDGRPIFFLAPNGAATQINK